MLPAAPWVSLGLRLSIKVFTLNPVNSMAKPFLTKGFLTIAEKGMLNVAINKIARRPLLALANIELPAKQMAVHKTRTIVPQRYSHPKPSRRKWDQPPD
jgi:hypothetical protein